MDYNLITSLDKWNALSEKGINYSHQDLDCRVQVLPQGILFESDIYPSKKTTWADNQLKIDGQFDVFGVIFFLLTRYEDYFSQNSDQHGRIRSEDNTLVKYGIHRIALVDRMVKDLWKQLDLAYETVLDGFKFLPTFDIDVAWAYKNRKLARSIGATIKGGKPVERIQVLAGMKKDPYDTYAEIRAVATESDGIICFTLLGDWGKYDKNIHWKNNAYGSLIRGLNLEGEIGIHPSYASHLDINKVEEEIKRLETITGHEIKLSRQHFLRLKIPTTYQLLEQLGIEEDYSMGFADEVGFRAGTCFPFFFFDLMTNRKTNLLIRPFAYMDSALKDYLKVSSINAQKIVEELLEEVRSVGGDFIFIWHNSSIHNTGEWKGWKELLDFTVKKGVSK